MAMVRDFTLTPTLSLRERELRPALGTVITGEGRVVFRDVTRYDLHRMCVETWMGLLKDKNVKAFIYMFHLLLLSLQKPYSRFWYLTLHLEFGILKSR